MSDQQARAKRYEAIHNSLFVVETVLSVVLLLAFLFSSGSELLANACRSISANPWVNVALYGAVVVIATKLISLPLNWFTDFYLEHRYGLSNESLGGWAWDELKSLGLNLVLSVVALEVIYFFLRRTGDDWWLWAGGALILLGILMSAVFPVVILPLFYKLEPLDNEALKQKLVALAQRVGAKVLGIYRMTMSAKTKKANAAFAGLGATKRIILGDTLLAGFSEDEIEVVMAHEMAHFKHGDLWKLLAVNAVTILGGFWICDWGFGVGVSRFGFADRADIGAFPVLALCLMFATLAGLPVQNAFSRWRERKADRLALDLTRNPAGFARAMRKLAEQNLADLAPHPVIEFLLHDHPSLESRITLAQEWQRKS
ncbi:MAG: Protease HtpX [Verrucomicrobiae bacterium]|nr:Protease HtpX [Verrucomicrobiae bacterium]